MVKIGKRPYIYELDNRWGVPVGTFAVMNVSGYVTDEMWKDLQEFENHSIAEEIANYVFRTGNSLNLKVKDITLLTFNELEEILPITNRLIRRARGQLWEFNMRQAPDSEEWARSYAILGEKSLKRWNKLDDIYVAYLEAKVRLMNRKNKTKQE